MQSGGLNKEELLHRLGLRLGDKDFVKGQPPEMDHFRSLYNLLITLCMCADSFKTFV